MPLVGCVRPMQKEDDSIKQYQVEGSLRADEMLFTVLKNLGRLEDLKKWVKAKKEAYDASEEKNATFDISGIYNFLVKNNFLQADKPAPIPESKKKNKKKKKASGKKEDL